MSAEDHDFPKASPLEPVTTRCRELNLKPSVTEKIALEAALDGVNVALSYRLDPVVAGLLRKAAGLVEDAQAVHQERRS